jgi:hypothetical protein
VLVGIILAGLFAVAGYQEARRFARQYGRTPWGWDPIAWAVALGLSWVIGIVLLAVAERQGRAAFTRGSITASTAQPTPADPYATSTHGPLGPEPAATPAPPPPAPTGVTILPGK